MSEPFEQPAPVSAYGRARREDWLAGLRASHDASTAAAMEAHRQDHEVVTSGQLGLFGDTTPQQQAALMSTQRRVGDGVGAGRDLQMLGGVDFASQGAGPVAPVPRGAYISPEINKPADQLGESPLAAYMRSREQ